MSLVTSMNVAQQSLLVNQAALNVVSNNIANMNTAGYSRERVELSPGVNYTPLGGSVLAQVYSGCGVELDSVQRYTDAYLQSYFRQQNSQNSYLNQVSDVANNIETMTNELSGSKLEDAFTSFFKAAQTLSSNPADSAARQDYVQQAQSIALKMNTLSNDLSTTRMSLVGDVSVDGSLQNSKIAGMIDQANNKLQQITKLNGDIVKISSSNLTPNNLLDARDQLITELSAMLPVNVVENTNGTVNISMNGFEVIQGTKLLGNLSVVQTSDNNNPVDIKIVDNNNKPVTGSINQYIDTGSIGAVLDLGSDRTDVFTIKGVSDSLDKLAKGFAQIINDLQTQPDANGSPMAIDNVAKQLKAVDPINDVIYNTSDGSATITAANIQINQSVFDDPYKIAAARVDTTSPTYDPNAIGDNGNMKAVLAARSTNYPSPGSPAADLNNSSPESFLSTMVGNIGLKVSDINNNLKNQSTVLTQVQNQLTSSTGVNLDEEIVDLTKYQRAYQASSRIFTVCNQLLDDLVKLGQ